MLLRRKNSPLSPFGAVDFTRAASVGVTRGLLSDGRMVEGRFVWVTPYDHSAKVMSHVVITLHSLKLGQLQLLAKPQA